MNWSSLYRTAWIHRLTHLCLTFHKRVIIKQCRPDQTPQNAASDQGLHHYLHEIQKFLSNTVRAKTNHTPLIGNRLVQRVKVKDPIGYKWVNLGFAFHLRHSSPVVELGGTLLTEKCLRLSQNQALHNTQDPWYLLCLWSKNWKNVRIYGKQN